MVMYTMTKLLIILSTQKWNPFNACLAITGAIQGTSREKIYQELGLESLQLCRWYRKLCLFYKVFKKEHPKYIFHVILVRFTLYATRTESNIPLILFLIFAILKESNLLQDLDLV